MTSHPPIEANLKLTKIERDFLVTHLANFEDVLDVLWNSGYWYHEIPMVPERSGLLTWIKDIDRYEAPLRKENLSSKDSKERARLMIAEINDRKARAACGEYIDTSSFGEVNSGHAESFK